MQRNVPDTGAPADQELGALGPDAVTFRRVLGHHATGVVVITAIDGGEPVGMSVGSFTSVSLDPPLVGFLPDKASTTWPRIERARRFCANVLADDQQQVARGFSLKGVDRFAGVAWRPGRNGAPVLDGVVAYVECDLRSVSDAGDHLFVTGDVRHLEVLPGRSPLLFFQGRYGRYRDDA